MTGKGNSSSFLSFSIVPWSHLMFTSQSYINYNELFNFPFLKIWTLNFFENLHHPCAKPQLLLLLISCLQTCALRGHREVSCPLILKRSLEVYLTSLFLSASCWEEEFLDCYTFSWQEDHFQTKYSLKSFLKLIKLLRLLPFQIWLR